ncbi:vomeronasal type-1 receptor 4-like [Elephas maximus indicus]|uniref:vomeronasal type-1 receptor 4-like n=1 Tax=Elephas maximus indicus TaxID=99487 RepID=UPI002116C7A7|nr:vomeronasal type-1 receptor 4-like [Elephas maximus indicus]
MSSLDLTFGTVFLLQTTVGILGSFSLLFQYIFLYFTKCRLPPTDLIVLHLTAANSVVILGKGIPQTMAAFGWKDFLNDFGCKFLFYVHRVERGVSIGSTCLLSIFQAITVSFRNSRWVELKEKAPKYMGFSNILCWILHMLVNIIIPMYMTSKCSNETNTNKKDYRYCSSVPLDKTANSLYALLLAFPDVVSLGLTLWFSGSMVLILQRHKQRVQHIHRNNISPRSSPETRAILVLVSTFVSFYTLSFILNIFVAVFNLPSWWMVNTGALTAACFAALSAFVLLTRDSSVPRLCFAWIRKTKFSHFIRNT